jgi:phosphoribosylformimino-5-aminoimidazole carboxamide ribotide isomerase
MLVYSSITLSQGKCVAVPVGPAGSPRSYSDDPTAMARLLRKENSKALHVVDLDGTREGVMRNLAAIRSLSVGLDIPMQVAGGIRDRSTAEFLLKDLGVARIVMTTVAFDDLPLLRQLIELFGPRKIAIGLDIRGDSLYSHGRTRMQDATPDVFGQMLRSEGIQRLVVTSLDGLQEYRQHDIERLVGLVRSTGCSITAAGYVWGYPDLKRLQELLPRKIDSVILDEALYGDLFPCQRIWRSAEAEEMKQTDDL